MNAFTRIVCAAALACALCLPFVSSRGQAQQAGPDAPDAPFGAPGLPAPLEEVIPEPLLAAVEQTRLQASDAAAEDRFGNSVALSADGNTALVGAPFDDHSGGVEVGSAYVFTRSGSTWTEQARLQAPDAAAGDFFGISVALSADGSTALVGAYGDDNSGGQNAGSAYVFTRSGSAWSHQQRLQASDAGISDFFGVSVSLSADGNTALVGAYADDNSGGNDAGSAYVFTRSGSAWSEQQRLQASDAAVADQFGVSVDLSADGNTALVGAHHDDNSGGTDAGSAYVFTRSGGTWTEQQRVQASDAAAFDRFGVSVALNSDGSIALVGAYQDDNSGGMNAGSAYVFTRSGGTWTEQQRLQASDAAANDQFGGSVALSGDGNTALAGANQDTNSGGTFAGSAYVFTRSGPALTEQQRLQASDAAPGDSFGISVALNADGSTALVGAQLDDNSGGTDAGSAYPFAIEQPAQAGQVVISEFRMSGHGGTLDEYFELYNATDTPRDISGYTLHWSHSNAASGNSITIPAGTVIPARSHYLVTGSAYSLGPYAAPDQPFVGLPQNSAVGLFKPSDISAAGRVDSVAFNDLSPAGGFYAAHVEGTPLPQTGDSTVEHAWVRKLTSGRPQDTNDNAADFMLVAVTAGTVGPVQSVLGAPGPENLSSPLAKNAATQIASHLIDPCVSSSQQPNRQRVTGSYTDTLSGTGTYPLGYMDIRRRFVNMTGANVTRLRFRVNDISTAPAPAGVADMRAISSPNFSVTVSAAGGGATIPVTGVTLEQPPTQPNGGGFNSSLALGTITVGTPLAPNASADVNFRLGVAQGGSFRFFVIVEALP